MRAVSRFLFLLVLLGIDWYFDTSFGQSPFDGPMSSTAAVCQSSVQKQRVCKRLEVANLIEATPLVEAADPHLSALPPLRGKAGAFVPPDADLAYVFMSMQC
jgi:hypothetical protein